MLSFIQTPTPQPTILPGLSQADFRSLSSDESMAMYVRWLQTSDFSAATIKSYRCWVKKFLDKCTSLPDAHSALPRSPQMHKLIEEFRAHLIEGGQICPQSTNNAISALDSFCRYLQIPLPTIPRQPKPAMDYPVLTRGELTSLLQVLESAETPTRDRAIVLTFLHGGLSLRNCRELVVDDIHTDWTASQITLTYGPAKQRQVLRIHGTSMLGKALLQWRAERATSGEDKSLFLSNAGQQLSASSFDLIVRKIGWKARVPLSVKLLRDTYLHYRRLGEQPE